MTFTVVCTYPMLMHPTRNSASLLCFARPAPMLSSSEWALLTLSLFACSLMLALLVSSLDLALGLVGGSTGMLIGFIFPGIFYYRIKGRSGTGHAATDVAELKKGEVPHEAVGGSTPYHLVNSDGARVRGWDWRRTGAIALAVGGTMLIPVLVGAQALKVVREAA